MGQNFYQYDRVWEHELFLNWLSEVIREKKIDVLLISGDVFDTANPSAASQKMYYAFLSQVTSENPNLQIIITAGNHDSASRLEAPRELLEVMNISVRGSIPHNHTENLDLKELLVPFDKGGVCLTVPYLRMGDFPAGMAYAEGVAYVYSELLTLAKNNIACGNIKNGPIVALGHLVASGAEFSSSSVEDGLGSERPIIGGVEGVSPEIFSEELNYTALGHLHKPQRVGGSENIRYSGPPIPLSFAERNNKQGVVLVTFDENSSSSSSSSSDISSYSEAITNHIEFIDFQAPVKLLRIPESRPMPKEDVLKELMKLPSAEIRQDSPYIEVNVLLREPDPQLKTDIESVLQGKAVRLTRIGTKTVGAENIQTRVVNSVEQLMEIEPMDIAIDVFRKKYGGEDMPEKMKTMLNEIIEEVK